VAGPASLERPGGGGRPPPVASATVLVLSDPIAHADIPALCERLRTLLRREAPGPVVFDVGALVDPDLITVDALARLQLTARRRGGRVRLRHASSRLEELLALVALGDVLPCGEESGFEPGRQAEEREQARRIQEEGDPSDPTA
jgi:ABC-type transporter Mla MlaB component